MANEAVRQFFQTVVNEDISEDDLKDLDPSIFKHIGSQKTQTIYALYSFIKIVLFVVFCILLPLIVCFLCFVTVTPEDYQPNVIVDLYRWSTFTIMDLMGRHPIGEHCSIRFVDVVHNFPEFSRPPIDCKLCSNINTVKRLKNLNSSRFEQKYAYNPGRPIIVADATKNWTALNTFSFEFLKSLYLKSPRSRLSGIPKTPNGEVDSMATAACQFFRYKTDFDSLEDVFEMSSERASLRDGALPWYVGWSNCDANIAAILRQHYGRPYFLPPLSESSKLDWIFMGSAGYGAEMHVDNVRYPSWQAQIRGTKRWTLQPPFECRYSCPSLTAVVHPGDIIVLDTNFWYHSTFVEGTDMSITIGSEFD